MLRALVAGSLKQPLMVVALACALLVAGYRTMRNSPLDVFPEFAPPLVEIQTEAPGLSTEEVESLITVPLENALNGTASAEDPALEVGARAVVGGADLRARHRPAAGPPARAGAAGRRGLAAAERGPAAGDPAAALFDEPGAEDRRLVQDALADGPDRCWPSGRSGRG